MFIAYSTYPLPLMPLEVAAPMLKDIGYEGVEICISPQHVMSMPQQQDGTRRHQLREMLVDLQLGIPALLVLGNLLPENAETHAASMELMRQCVALARDLGMGEPPVISMQIGGTSDDWGRQRDRIIDSLGDYDRLAAEEGFVLAAAVGHGAAIDRSERALDIIHSVNTPRVRLHFDIVPFYLAGENVTEAVERLESISAHTHIGDTHRHKNGRLEPLLLGQGDMDIAAYLSAMDAAGWDDFITIKIDERIWGGDGYDVEDAARISYAALRRAFAGVG